MCELITKDGGKALLNALEIVHSRIPRQHCWVHESWNVLEREKADQEQVKRDLHRISNTKSRPLAI